MHIANENVIVYNLSQRNEVLQEVLTNRVMQYFATYLFKTIFAKFSKVVLQIDLNKRNSNVEKNCI